MKTWRLFVVIIFLSSLPKFIEEKGEGYRGLASSWTIVPSRSLAGLHYVFKGFKFQEDTGFVNVSGPVIQITNGQKWGSKIDAEGYSAEMDSDDFEEEQILAQSVFEATTRTGLDVGTAFLVGSDIVLTNRHVMVYPRKSSRWECGKFHVKLNHKNEKVFCQKVRFCSPVHDYCVVEMQKMQNGLSIGAEVRPLRLTQKVRSNPDVNLLHIGNAAGLGIQASSGRGLKVTSNEFYHYAPTLGGSSGAPIFDERKEVIGLNWGHTGDDMEDHSFNRGILARTIFVELSKSSPETLKKIKSMRSWYHRNSKPRKVKITSR